MTRLGETPSVSQPAVGILAPERVLTAGRSAELIELRSQVQADRSLPPLRPPRRRRLADSPLRIVYLVPVTWPGDGARVLFDQINQLSAIGDELTVLSHFPRPGWTDLHARFVEVPLGQSLHTAIPECDLIVAGFWEQILPARRTAIAPVVHFEQGSSQLFSEVDPHTLVTMAASVRAADATLTVSTACAAALAERFGVTAEVVPIGVDCDRFSPRDASPPRRSVLFAGDDAEPADGMLLARQVAVELASTHPQLDVVWATPHAPSDGPFGRVVVNPSERDRAQLYREARVFVCTAGAGSSNLRLLEAMACGAPVVAASQPGNAELLANVHNALVGPAGDAPALAALARQVLDDATLAAELAEAGLETARHTACPAAVRDVRAVLEKVLLVKDEEMSLELQGMGAAASGASGDEPDVDLRDIVLGGEDAAAQLLARARSCPTRELAIPVSRPVIGAFRRVTWEVVARQPLGDPGVTRAYLPGRGEQRPDAGELEDGLAALRRGDHQGALATLLPELQQGDKERQASLLRWVVVALLGLRRWQDALGLASAGFEAYPTHPDFLALSFIAATAASAPMDLEVTMRSVKLLGNGSRFDEWLDDPLGLMRQHLVGGLGLQP